MRKSVSPLQVLAVLLAALIGVGIYAATLGWDPIPRKDQHFEDPGLPYSFTYPGKWDRIDQQDLPPLQFGNLAGISRDRNTHVLVGTFPMSAGQTALRIATSYRALFERDGGTVQSVTYPKVGGLDAVRLDVDYVEGHQDGSSMLVLGGTTGFYINCVWFDRDAGLDACEKVLKTFKVKRV